MSLGATIFVITFTFILYITVRTIYRLFLSPLAQVPGPRLAAVSRLYELYFDLAKGGRLPWKIQELHNEYGRPVGGRIDKC